MQHQVGMSRELENVGNYRITFRKTGAASFLKVGAGIGLAAGFTYENAIGRQVNDISDRVAILVVLLFLGPLNFFSSLKQLILIVLAFNVVVTLGAGVAVVGQNGIPLDRAFVSFVDLLAESLLTILHSRLQSRNCNCVSLDNKFCPQDCRWNSIVRIDWQRNSR